MLMADIKIDTRVVPKGEITIDLDAPFDAHQFYRQMRDWGLNPYVVNDGVYCGCNGQIERMEVFSWAHAADPDRSIRDEYARAAWEKRTSDDEIISIGLGPTLFDAHTFYVGLRDCGHDPCVHQRTSGDLSEVFGGGTDGVIPLYDWARESDPDRVLRKQYIRSVWAARPASDQPVKYQFVPLGV